MKQLLFKVRQQIDDIVLNKQDLNNDPKYMGSRFINY